MRIANGVFAALFLFSAAVQYNDPDPVQWMAIYMAAFGCCLAWDRYRLPRAVPAVLAAISLSWGVVIALGVRLTVPVGEAVTDWKMHNGGSEELRETMGLSLVALWMAALAAKPKGRPPR